jgi:hypothetical protein
VGGNLTTDKATAEVGETVTVTYTADGGYELDTIWVYKAEDESTTVPFACSGNICTFTMPAYAVTVVASFKSTGEVPSYPVALAPESPGTTGGSLTTETSSAKAGETVTVIYTADSGYEFEAIWVYKTGDESTTVPLSCSGNICTFTMPAYPVTARASFKKADNAPGYPVTLSNGIVGGNLTTNKPTAMAGETVTVIYTAEIGYEFESIWGYKTGDESTAVPLSCSGNICTFTMPEYPVTVRASFKRADGGVRYAVTLPVTSIGGRVTTDKTLAAAGETVTLTFFPGTGYTFGTAWAYNTNRQSETIPLYCSGNVCAFTMPAYPVTIIASFTRTSSPAPNPGTSKNSSGGGGCNANALGIGIFALAGAVLFKRHCKS